MASLFLLLVKSYLHPIIPITVDLLDSIMDSIQRTSVQCASSSITPTFLAFCNRSSLFKNLPYNRQRNAEKESFATWLRQPATQFNLAIMTPGTA